MNRHMSGTLFYLVFFQFRWKAQNIAGGGVPENICPNDKWDVIPTFKLFAPTAPSHSVRCGPVYLAGDCKTSGLSVRFVILLLTFNLQSLDGLGILFSPSLLLESMLVI